VVQAEVPVISFTLPKPVVVWATDIDVGVDYASHDPKTLEVTGWCRDNVQHGWSYRTEAVSAATFTALGTPTTSCMVRVSVIFDFEHDDDATLFKLKWA